MHLYDMLTDPCSPMACGHMCVNAKSGSRCLCAEGFQLAADGKTCTGCTHCQKNVYFWIVLCHLIFYAYYTLHGHGGGAVDKSFRVGLVFYSRLDRHKSLKHVVTALLLHARRQVWVSQVLWYSIITGDLCHSRCGTLKKPSLFNVNERQL